MTADVDRFKRDVIVLPDMLYTRSGVKDPSDFFSPRDAAFGRNFSRCRAANVLCVSGAVSTRCSSVPHTPPHIISTLASSGGSKPGYGSEWRASGAVQLRWQRIYNRLPGHSVGMHNDYFRFHI